MRMLRDSASEGSAGPRSRGSIAASELQTFQGFEVQICAGDDDDADDDDDAVPLQHPPGSVIEAALALRPPAAAAQPLDVQIQLECHVWYAGHVGFFMRLGFWPRESEDVEVLEEPIVELQLDLDAFANALGLAAWLGSVARCGMAPRRLGGVVRRGAAWRLGSAARRDAAAWWCGAAR